MTLSRRVLARAGVLAFGALTLAACSDSSTAPLTVTPDQLQSMGESAATEIEGAIASITAQDIMNTNGGAPSFSRVPRSAPAMFGGLSLNRYAVSRSTTDISQCGAQSPATPDDPDGDLVPTSVSVTFALPACHFVNGTDTYDVTGVLRVSDPAPTTPSMALSFALDNFKLAFSGTNGSGYVSRNGTASVSVTSGSLSQSATWTDNAVLTGVASASDNINWTNVFVAAQGQSITAGQALPDGAFSPNGSVTIHQGNRQATFSVTTIDALQYSASCAAGVAQGTSLTPFTAGRVRVNVSNQQNSAYVDVTYSNCSSATVTLVQ